MYQNRARWYDPNTGRFLSEDPAGDGPNPYRYSGNDPINFRDPTGLFQAGNPLNDLALNLTVSQNGGFSGNQVGPAPKPIEFTPAFSPTFVNTTPVQPTLTEVLIGGPSNSSFQTTVSPFVPRAIDTIRAREIFERDPIVVGIDNGFRAAGNAFRDGSNAIATRIETATSGFGGVLGNVAAGVGALDGSLIRSVGNALGGLVDFPRFVDSTVTDIEESIQLGQQHGVRVGVGNLVGTNQIVQAFVGNDFDGNPVDFTAKLSEGFARLSGTAGTLAGGITKFFSPKKARAPIQVELELATKFEQRAQVAARQLGETVIQSQVKQGAVNRGFDFLSFTGTGKNARLFINEVKNVAGKVATRSFSTFGLGKSGLKSFNQSLGFATEAINSAGLGRATTNALLNQLAPGGNAAIRLIGSQAKGTVFNPFVNDLIGQTTNFITGEGFLIK